MAASVPGAQFIEIANAGHLPCVEQPETFARLLQNHLGGAALQP